ncbi:Alpha-L-arabinofuranosidase 2 [Glycine soja]|uniref:Alpha-L-arabinofuranosidase 2 n=1 Tax=Glycine soja TaxID=3848 RepID=A0A0B2S2C5_GLYSO|nr:Alpha-L-arabinofuranosidase 2 [Glycine soja]
MLVDLKPKFLRFPGIFVSEYAVKSDAANGNLLAAVAEAAFLIGLEKNNDVVEMVSYAPLFLNINDKRFQHDAHNNMRLCKCVATDGFPMQLCSTLIRFMELLAIGCRNFLLNPVEQHFLTRHSVVNFRAAAESLHIDINGLDSNV